MTQDTLQLIIRKYWWGDVCIPTVLNFHFRHGHVELQRFFRDVVVVISVHIASAGFLLPFPQIDQVVIERRSGYQEHSH